MGLKSISIPGKVMLSGEYAVLYGGKATLVPLPRFLHLKQVKTKPAEEYAHVVKTALQYPIAELAGFESREGLPELEIDYREFYEEDENGRLRKLGLGSSAAEAVGVLALRYERAGYDIKKIKAKLFEQAVAVHNQAQNNLGSGADVAACAYASPLIFQKRMGDYKVKEIIDPGLTVPLYLLWSGIPADTREMVSKFSRFADDRENRRQLGSLVEAANELSTRWFDSSKTDLFNALAKFDAIIDECMDKANIAYRLPVHREISSWAESYGGLARPTGAGGGDMILLIGDLPVGEMDKPILEIG